MFRATPLGILHLEYNSGVVRPGDPGAGCRELLLSAVREAGKPGAGGRARGGFRRGGGVDHETR